MDNDGKGGVVMILRDIKEYLSQQQTASLAELSLHFNVNPDAMRGMLDHWIRKGKLSKLPHEKSCSSCCGCHSQKLEMYRWVV